MHTNGKDSLFWCHEVPCMKYDFIYLIGHLLNEIDPFLFTSKRRNTRSDTELGLLSSVSNAQYSSNDINLYATTWHNIIIGYRNDCFN